jgi:hypothetical protein
VTCLGSRWELCGVWQTDRATPLYIASKRGFIEYVAALLDRGTAINQATVGCANSVTWYREGCACGDVWEPACMRA